MNAYLTFEEEGSRKFWSIQTSGASFTVIYGKIGTDGTSQTKTFDSEALCLKEAEKLLHSKLKKGYVASTQSSSATSVAPKADKEKPLKQTLKAKTYRRLPAVTDFATNKRHSSFETFDPTDLELYDQGFPNLVLLDDNHPDNKKVEKLIVHVNNAVDQVYDTIWPTDVAIAYVHTYPTHPGFKPEPTPAFAKKWKAFQKLESKVPTVATAKALVAEFMPGSDTYSGWKAPAAFYILEHFIGAEAVAQAIVDRLGDFDKKQWSAPRGKDAHTRIALEVLGFLMLRMGDDARQRIQQNIDLLIAQRPAKDTLTQHLAYLPDRPVKITMEEYSSENGPWFISELTVSPEPRWKHLEEYGVNYIYERAIYLEGADRLTHADLSWLLNGISKYSMTTKIHNYGKIKHPYIVRMILSFGKFKSMIKEVNAWKEQHADYVASVLPLFEKDEFVKKGLKGLDPSVVPVKKAKDPMKATEKLLEEVEKALPKAFPNQKKVTALIQKAADEAREIARLDGQDYPECYFVALWAEFPFSLETSEAEYELLYNAYEEVIMGGE